MKNLQLTPMPLSMQAYQAGQNASYPLDQLPTTVQGRIAHLAGFLIEPRITPTFTTAPTLAGFWSVLSKIVLFDGVTERMNLNAWQLRAQLIQEQARFIMPDPDLNSGTGNGFYARIPLPMGPLNSAGWQTDWIYPCAALKSGELRFTYGENSAFSADTTNLSGQIRVTAMLATLDDEIRIPPLFERRSYNFSSNDVTVQGRAKYNSALLTKQNNAAWSAGDLGSITVDTGAGTIPSTPASQLAAINQFAAFGSIITQLRGEPLAATDDNEKVVDLTSPTAIAAAGAFFQPLISPIYDGRITKIQYEALSAMRFYWSGSFATPSVTVGRILPQPMEQSAAIAAMAASILNKGEPKGGKVKTLSGRPWQRTGMSEFMPLSFRW